MSEAAEPKTRRWPIPIRHDQHIGSGVVGHSFPGNLRRYALAFTGVGSRNVAARAKTDAMQDDGLGEGCVIRLIGISSLRGARQRESDYARRQHQNRQQNNADKLHGDSLAKAGGMSVSTPGGTARRYAPSVGSA